ncbi:MAG: hypothetical protein ACHQHL_01920 [Steroidobacterales bacterium]|jgi:hypothetical protein
MRPGLGMSSRRMTVDDWQGEFPSQNTLADGYEGASPVGRIRPIASPTLGCGGGRGGEL